MLMDKEPSPRWGHFTAPFERRLYVWGGRTDDSRDGPTKTERDQIIYTYDPYLELWSELNTRGCRPPRLYVGACAWEDRCMYLYGGAEGSDVSLLCQLDMKTLVWTQLCNRGVMRKGECGMVAYNYGDELVLFGGYGRPFGPAPMGSKFIKDSRHSDGRGWTNELHTYDLKKGVWSSHNVSGTKPPPCSHFSLTMIDDHHAVMFGGYQPGQGWTNEVYILDLARMHWSKLEHHDGEPCPVGNVNHAAVCLGHGRHQTRRQLLVTGGRDQTDNVLNEVWILDLQSGRWKEVKIPNLASRCDHTAVAFNLSQGLTEIVLFGGCPGYPKLFRSNADLPRIANTTVLRFEYSRTAGEWVLTDVADNTQLGTSNRVRGKMVQMGQATLTSIATPGVATMGGGVDIVRTVRELREKAMQAELCVGEVVTQYEEGARTSARRLVEIEQRERESEERARDAETRAVEAERKWREAMEECERRVQAAEERAEAADERSREAERREEIADTRRQVAERNWNEMEQEHRLSMERVIQAERSLVACQERLREWEEKAHQWLVERREIRVTGEELGRGGWATVSVAMFRGIRVAAKFIHNQIVSPHNERLFKREMDMAARIRHPNMLQFIGATLEGEMIILTELMPTSLRRELEGGYMSPRLVTSIGLDVLRALNYLHQMRPHPLIHRDISSANVLLEPLPNSRWRAKVSDYGTVNLQEHLQTVGPGNPCYAAPEAEVPAMQSPKMDIFSFGALFMEMLTGELPESDERPRLFLKIHHQPLLSLIRRCLCENKENRPTANDIISELDP